MLATEAPAQSRRVASPVRLFPRPSPDAYHTAKNLILDNRMTANRRGSGERNSGQGVASRLGKSRGCSQLPVCRHSPHRINNSFWPINLNVVAATIRHYERGLRRKGGQALLQSHQGRLPLLRKWPLIRGGNNLEWHIRKWPSGHDLPVAFGNASCSRYAALPGSCPQFIGCIGARRVQQNNTGHLFRVLSGKHLDVGAAE